MRNNLGGFSELMEIFGPIATFLPQFAAFLRVDPVERRADDTHAGPRQFTYRGNQMLKFFISDESGSLTMDWLVLTAALLGLVLAISVVVNSGLDQISHERSTQPDPQTDAIYLATITQ